MARTKGAKNKPKNGLIGLQCGMLPDFLTPAETAIWWRTSRSSIMRQIRTGEIPEDCYEMRGSHYKLIRSKLATLKGINELPRIA